MTKVYMHSMCFGEIPVRIGALDRLQGGLEIELSFNHPTISIADIKEKLQIDTGDWHTNVLTPLYPLIQEKIREQVQGAPQAFLFWRLPPTLVGIQQGILSVTCIFSLWWGQSEELHPHDHRNFSLAPEFNWTGYNDITPGSQHTTEV